MQEQDNAKTANEKKPIYKKWWFWVIIVVLLFGIGASTSDQGKDVSDTSVTKQTENSNNVALDEKFVFDDLEIVLGSNLLESTLNNEFSEYHKSKVIKMPITITNVGNESNGLNPFYIKFFGSKGTETDNVLIYFDDSVYYAGDLRNGATKETYLYFLYDGDGDYAIELDNFSSKKSVEFKVSL